MSQGLCQTRGRHRSREFCSSDVGGTGNGSDCNWCPLLASPIVFVVKSVAVVLSLKLQVPFMLGHLRSVQIKQRDQVGLDRVKFGI